MQAQNKDAAGANGATHKKYKLMNEDILFDVKPATPSGKDPDGDGSEAGDCTPGETSTKKKRVRNPDDYESRSAH